MAGYRTPYERHRMGEGAPKASMDQAPGQLEDAYDENAMPSKDEGEPGAAPTADIPIALLGGKEFKPGEEIVMKIVNVDSKAGMVKIAYATGDDHDEMGDEHPAVAGMPGGEDEKGY